MDRYIPCKIASAIWLGFWHPHFVPICEDTSSPMGPDPSCQARLDLQAPSNLYGSDTQKLTFWPCIIDTYPALPLLKLSSQAIWEEREEIGRNVAHFCSTLPFLSSKHYNSLPRPERWDSIRHSLGRWCEVWLASLWASSLPAGMEKWRLIPEAKGTGDGASTVFAFFLRALIRLFHIHCQIPSFLSFALNYFRVAIHLWASFRDSSFF